MARSFRRNVQLSAIADPNVTPLLDLAFSLLIIFMITTPLLEQTIPLDLPSQSAGGATSSEEIRYQTISIKQPGLYVWGDGDLVRELGSAEMNAALADLARQTEPPVLHIRADAGISYQEVVTLLDMIGKNNLTKISLDTAVK